ncbi:hypothetical protein JQX13_06165 [Archangium violaceum]|uniref:hypothetical protein n=1 Tax=Archangium violaceum TaxID=83451 RepID=UPI00193B80F1|nr:hypothetical protein [Archangium violaceum]QRK09705.1 hypothetical protein JQX13_06165 [Archangium violaceum]
MRERLTPVLLALLLCAASPVRAEAPLPPPPAPAQAEVAPTEEAELAEVEADSEVRGEDYEEERVRGYDEVQSQPENATEGDLRVSVSTAVLRPPRGYAPLEVVLHNQGSTPRVARVDVETTGRGRGEVASRQVEVGPRQRLSVWLPIPVAARGGIVRVLTPGLSLRAFSFYTVEPGGDPVLVLGSERAFQSGTRLPRVKTHSRLSVQFVAPEAAPRELALYAGHSLVVVAGDVTSLPADTWSALEAYASTGGFLVLLHPPRDVDVRLPLLAGTTSGGVHPYGFGQVRLCGAADACGSALLSDADATNKPTWSETGGGTPIEGIILPAAPAPSWQRNTYMLAGGAQPLLPGVQAPVGRFLFLITLFVLAVGPGGLALARRKGPVALLIAVPSVAFVTCLSLVVWSVFVDGFSLHASRYSLIWLDRDGDRAVMVGLGSYYANLEPEGFHVPALATLLGPDVAWEPQVVEADWTNGMAVTGGFLSSRTYREWGELAVLPSRARLTVRREGEGLRVQNALGAPLAEGYVRLDGKVWSLPALADGAEGVLTPIPDSASRKTALRLSLFSEHVENRFINVPWAELDKPLPEGGFLARLEGPGLMPTAVLPVELHEGLHLMRGRVDGP